MLPDQSKEHLDVVQPLGSTSERRYLLRLWPGMEPSHLRDVLSVLEPHS